MFIINCKNYDEISGDKIVKLAKISQKISKKYKIPIAIAPPPPNSIDNKVQRNCSCSTS